MKIRALLLVVSIVSLLAALVWVTGIIVDRGGNHAQGITIESNPKPRPPHWF